MIKITILLYMNQSAYNSPLKEMKEHCRKDMTTKTLAQYILTESL